MRWPDWEKFKIPAKWLAIGAGILAVALMFVSGYIGYQVADTVHYHMYGC